MENELHPPSQGCFRKPFSRFQTNLDLESMAKYMAIPRLISEAKSRKSLEIVEDDKN